LDIIEEPLKANFPKMRKGEMDEKAKAVAVKVGLNPFYLATGKSHRTQMALFLATPSFNQWSGKLHAWLEQDTDAKSAAPPVKTVISA
jgi:hypothetical protein